MKSNPNEFEPYGKDWGKAFDSPFSVCRVSTNAMTLPSSNGSCGSISSGADSIVAPPPIDNDGEQSDTSSVEPSGYAASKIIVITTAFLLLFGAGLLGGLMATGRLSRTANVPSYNNEGAVAGNQTVDGPSRTDSPSAIPVVTFDSPTAAPSDVSGEQKSPTADPATKSPTESPTEITADVTRVPIPPPPTSELFPYGTYNYRANSEYLVGV
jgi:hypothetical protein